MDPDRVISLTDAALLAGCSRKSLERRVERGTIVATHDAAGRRAVRVADLMCAGLVVPVPTGAAGGVDPRRLADARAEAAALMSALAATEAALARARDESALLRQRVMDAEGRAAMAEDELTRVLLGAERDSRRGRRTALRLRTT